MSRHRSSACLAVVALLVTLSPLAQAQDDPRKAQSTPFFEEGLRLADKGRQAEALEKFQKAHAFYPSPNTLFNIGRTEQLLGRRLDAMQHYREALRNPVLLPQNAALAKQYVADLERVLGRVKVTGPAGTKVTVGSKELRLPMDEPVDVEAGAVVVKGDHDGTAYEARGFAMSGETIIVELKTRQGAATNASVADAARADTLPPAEVPESEGKVWKPLTFVLGGATVLAGGLAIYFNAKSHSADDRATSLRNEHAGANCSGSSPPSFCGEIQSAASDQDSAASASKVSWVGAGILLAATGISGVLWATSGSRQRTGARILPIAGPSTAGASVRLVF